MKFAQSTKLPVGLDPATMDAVCAGMMPTRSASIASDGLPVSRSIEGVARAIERMQNAREDARLAAIHLLLRVVDHLITNGEDEDYEAAIMLAKWCRDWREIAAERVHK